MKKNILFIVLFIALSCNKKTVRNANILNKGKTIERYDYEQINDLPRTIGAYKYPVFATCLRIGFSNSKEINKLLGEEVFISDQYNLLVNKLIDSLAYATRKKIIEDSIYLSKTWVTPYGDFKDLVGKKRVIEHCLELFLSTEFDSVFIYR